MLGDQSNSNSYNFRVPGATSGYSIGWKPGDDASGYKH
jgi:hypothetical protein